MRLSLWHSFSSNHSARFSVVGVFPDASEARQAGETLHKMLLAIRAWMEDPANRQARELWEGGGGIPPTPVELTFAREYGVPWGPYAIDWLYSPVSDDVPVDVFGNLVLIHGYDSGTGAHPADVLLERLGGKAFVDGARTTDYDISSDLRLHLTCVAPDDKVAEKIEGEILTYLRQRPTVSVETPWNEYMERNVGSSFDGTVARIGRHLMIKNGTFFHFAHGFMALNAYLMAHACTQIVWDFEEVA